MSRFVLKKIRSSQIKITALHRGPFLSPSDDGSLLCPILLSWPFPFAFIKATYLKELCNQFRKHNYKVPSVISWSSRFSELVEVVVK